MTSKAKALLVLGLLILVISNVSIFTGALLKLQQSPHNQFWLLSGIIFWIAATGVAIKDLFTQKVDANIRAIWLMSFLFAPLSPLATFIYYVKRLAEERKPQFS